MQLDFEYPSIKKCLIGVVLLVCMAGVFQQGIFEIVHVLSHQFTGGYNFHSHHSDLEDSDHEHFISGLSKRAFEQFINAPANQDKRLQVPLDKIPQICPSIVYKIDLAESKNKNKPFFNWQLPSCPFLQITTPPPEFAIG